MLRRFPLTLYSLIRSGLNFNPLLILSSGGGVGGDLILIGGGGGINDRIDDGAGIGAIAEG